MRLSFFAWSLIVATWASGWADDGNNADGVIIGEPALEDLLAQTGATGGVVVQVGCGDGAGTAELAKQGEAYLVQGLDVCLKSLDRARQRARALGLAGRLSFRRWEGGPLPYADNLVNVLFWQKPAEDADGDEILRVLAPYGKAYIQQGTEWREVTKAWPADVDQWPHFRYDAGNTGASKDARVGPPNHLQWEAGPRFMRSHEIETGLSSIVSAKGRVYYILDEGPLGITDARFPAKWSLICRDGFNGVLLWKRPMPNWGWRAWNAHRVNTPVSWLATRHHSSAEVDRLMVAHGDTLYVPVGFGGPISAIDGATGALLMTYEETAGMLECIVIDGVLITRSEDAAPVIAATRAGDGKTLWRHEADMVLPRSLCAAGGRVFFHTRRALIALDLTTGDELWRHETDLRPAALMAHDDAVLAVQSSQTLALSARTGEELWKGPGVGVRGRNPDIFVVGDHVYWGRGRFEVRHVSTGEIAKSLEPKLLLKSGHHRRCFTDRASANYMITGQRGSEFLDLHGNNHKRHNWLRGPCLTGMMPANGLFYVPPHQCFCYPGVRMDGFFALASQRAARRVGSGDTNAQRLERGPAYAQAHEMPVLSADEWHTYRRNAKRSGAIASHVPAQLDRLWSTALGGNLTQAIVAGGRVFVACKDAGTLHCLDPDSGTVLWSRTVGGRIDSPPSYHAGFVFFGSCDGFVYSLRADDGEVAWTFRAAPEERQVVSYDRLESAWPAHGSVLILDGLVYCSAGRSGFIDGGIHLYALDAMTGEVVHRATLAGPDPDISRPSYAFHDDGYRSDLLTTDGQFLYMGRTALDRVLNVVETQRVHLIGNQRGDELEYRKMPGMRLVATGGLLNDTFWNRTWWMYSHVWPGYHFAVQAPKSGQLLVFDDRRTYTVKHYTTRNLHSPMQFPGNGYLLFADHNDNEPLFYRGEGEPKPITWEVEYPPSERPEVNLLGDAAHDKGPGFSRAQRALWTSWIDVRVEAMVLADDTLFVAGTPDVVPADDPLAALEGRMGGVLKAISAKDGNELAAYTLESPPVFDGLIAAKGRLLIATRDGNITCMGRR
ncbi:MAG: PQQ-binding-like beta-propeller repeat protein [Thermoguttaceae bacterium]|jgi:outer membrane protein assembly factor BamB/SAM-dependent methyltransferase|nr:PQQ-binding-like beta-propeller repeat protein [Thermoguttaceae bacterium]